jgi:hypothetical protein
MSLTLVPVGPANEIVDPGEEAIAVVRSKARPRVEIHGAGARKRIRRDDGSRTPFATA